MVFMNLAKAYDCLPHDLLLTKLAAHDSGTNSLNCIALLPIELKTTCKNWQYLQFLAPCIIRCTTGLNYWISSIQYLFE